MRYTVKQLADVAEVSPRTLHYYDEIGLLKPSTLGVNGYRYYDQAALLRLQQILIYRELDFSLTDIQAILDQPDFNLLRALKTHHTALVQRVKQLNTLIQTVDKTITSLEEHKVMKAEDIFNGFSEEHQGEYAEEASQRWDPTMVRQSNQRWKACSAHKQADIMAEGNRVYDDLVANMDKPHDGAVVQAIIGRWHQHLRYFYEPTIEVLRGLGQVYVDDAAFAANLRKLSPGLPEFMRQAITVYCDRLALA
jgi:DNA-binding transcriptional MerR regulator